MSIWTRHLAVVSTVLHVQRSTPTHGPDAYVQKTAHYVTITNVPPATASTHPLPVRLVYQLKAGTRIQRLRVIAACRSSTTSMTMHVTDEMLHAGTVQVSVILSAHIADRTTIYHLGQRFAIHSAQQAGIPKT